MSVDTWTLWAIAAMALAALLCRFGGYWFMRFIPLSPRMRAGLEAMPLAVMLGIIIPPALRGGVPELAGIGATAIAVLLGRNELLALLAGMATVAGCRWLGL